MHTDYVQAEVALHYRCTRSCVARMAIEVLDIQTHQPNLSTAQMALKLKGLEQAAIKLKGWDFGHVGKEDALNKQIWMQMHRIRALCQTFNE